LGQTLVAASCKYLWLLLFERSACFCDSKSYATAKLRVRRADQRNRGECDGQVSGRMDV